MEGLLQFQKVDLELSKKEIEELFGEVSFAYTDLCEDIYSVVAISEMEPQYLKMELMIHGIYFIGVETTINIEYFSEVF